MSRQGLQVGGAAGIAFRRTVLLAVPDVPDRQRGDSYLKLGKYEHGK